MKIHTYYNPVPAVGLESALKLLLLWRENWTDKGFQPVVLNEYYARQHPLFDRFEMKIKRLPTVNPPDYERACYMRWLAMAQVGGGIMADYDLFIYETHQRKLPYLPEKERDLPSVPHSCQCHIPSLVYGNGKAFLSIVEAIMGYEVSHRDILEERGEPHVSDMLILLNSGVAFDQSNFQVANYNDDAGWIAAPFTHFANVAMGDYKPRYQHIQKLRDWK